MLLISGICNIFLIKGDKQIKDEHRLWLHFFELKFVLACFLTPLVKPMLYIFESDEDKHAEVQSSL